MRKIYLFCMTLKTKKRSLPKNSLKSWRKNVAVTSKFTIVIKI